VSVNIDLYEDTGAVLSGRGTVITLVDHWNLKASAEPAFVYYPTDETSSAPLIRPVGLIGAQTLSFKKYLSFKIDGTYSKIKNIRMKLTAVANNTDAAQLFYKFTNTYQVPDNAFDGDMVCASTNSTILDTYIWPNLGASPDLATSRNVIYGPNETLWTQFIVFQMRVNSDCVVGNSSEFTLRLECSEY
jgi:hypothetical protein